MSHHYILFRTTTFDSSRQNYFFKWYIQGLYSVILKNPADENKQKKDFTFPFFPVLTLL